MVSKEMADTESKISRKLYSGRFLNVWGKAPFGKRKAYILRNIDSQTNKPPAMQVVENASAYRKNLQ